MHEAIFCLSFHSPACRVLGRKLRNYAIGHEIALTGQGNPLVTYSEKAFDELSLPAKRLALAMAVKTCCYHSPLLEWFWVLRMIRVNLEEEIAKFREYRAASTHDLPTMKMPRAHGAPFHYFGAPELARLLNYVTQYHGHMIKTHFEDSPLNFPLGLARMLFSTHCETEGAIWIKNFQDSELERKATTSANEKILTGEEADKAFAEIVAKANKGSN